MSDRVPFIYGIVSGRANPYKHQVFNVRKLDEMMRTLAAIEMKDWRNYVFSREPLNGRFTDEQRAEWMEKASGLYEEIISLTGR